MTEYVIAQAQAEAIRILTEQRRPVTQFSIAYMVAMLLRRK